MSSSSTRIDKMDKAAVKKNHRILLELLQQSNNKFCADCKRKDPRWASWNLGIFICIKCSGIHRSLGTHISKVKSVDLDAWTTEQVQNMQRWGNKLANRFWEANLQSTAKTPSEHNMEGWIRAKYERKAFAMASEVPEPEILVSDPEDNFPSPQPSQLPSSTTAMKSPAVNAIVSPIGELGGASLLDFGPEPPMPSASTATATTANFDALNTTTPMQNFGNDLGGLGGLGSLLTSPPPAAAVAQQTQQQPQSNQKNPDALKSYIMSLYK